MRSWTKDTDGTYDVPDNVPESTDTQPFFMNGNGDIAGIYSPPGYWAQQAFFATPVAGH